jgi:oxygen-independent coproporphyrinogen-3 oxidase
MIADGLVSISSDEIAVTETGRLFVRNICMAFDAYLDHDTEKGPRYSRTV